MQYISTRVGAPPDAGGHVPYTRFFYHLIWRTKNSQPFLANPEIRTELHSIIGLQCQRNDGHAWAVGGVADHLHVLVTIPPTVAVATFIGKVKGASSYIASRKWPEELERFAWQAEYGALTIAESQFVVVSEYVRDQERHHAISGRLIAALEKDC